MRENFIAKFNILLHPFWNYFLSLQTDWLLVVWFTLFTNFSFFVLNRNISVQIRIMLLWYRIIFVLPRK